MTVRAQTPVRDPKREREFLEHASRGSLHPAPCRFVEHALHRLELGESKFGDRWATLPLDEFVRELTEETADLGAWAVLARQAHTVQRHTNLVDAHIDACLERVARAGAEAHRVLEVLQRHISRHRAQAEPATPVAES
jgi:hypothetical protein